MPPSAEAPEPPEARPIEVPARLVPLVEELAAKMQAEKPADALFVALGTLGAILDHQNQAGLVLLVHGSDLRYLNAPVVNGVRATYTAHFAGQGLAIELFEPRRVK